jgi:tetratricopeptide (TPR) repeat protein
VLSEEALVLLAVLGALALLILGILELVWPTRPRHGRRGYPAPVDAARRARRRAATGSPGYERKEGRPGVAEPSEPSLDEPRGEAPAPARDDAFAERLEASVAASADEPAGRVAERDAPADEPVGPPPVEPEPAAQEVAPAGPRLLEPSAVETCFELYQARRFDEVVALGTAALTGRAAAPASAQERAALWSVVGLARQQLGDHEAARTALESAIEVAPAADRPTYQRHLATLALNVGQALLARAEGRPTPEGDERLADMRSALAWLARGLAAVPGDHALAELSAETEAALWPAYELVVMALIQRQEYHAARRLLREALADERFPEGRGDQFRDMLLGTFSGEIGQLTAGAIRSMQEARESEALASLRRAEELLDTIPNEALPPKRREEVDARLWWGYTRLGIRHVEAGEFEEALDLLLHALGFGTVGPERQEETRSALLRALEGIVDSRSLTIRQLAEQGERHEAMVRSEKLWSLLRSSVDLGLSEDELSVAFAKAQRLMEQLDQPRS